MTGPEHYAEAEDLVLSASMAGRDADPNEIALILRFAQVHATLALTYATVSTLDDNRLIRSGFATTAPMSS